MVVLLHQCSDQWRGATEQSNGECVPEADAAARTPSGTLSALIATLIEVKPLKNTILIRLMINSFVSDEVELIVARARYRLDRNGPVGTDGCRPGGCRRGCLPSRS